MFFYINVFLYYLIRVLTPGHSIFEKKMGRNQDSHPRGYVDISGHQANNHGLSVRYLIHQANNSYKNSFAYPYTMAYANIMLILGSSV